MRVVYIHINYRLMVKKTKKIEQYEVKNKENYEHGKI